MSERDIERLVYIATTADGGCSNCAGGIADELARYWPEVPWREKVRAYMNADEYPSVPE